MDEEERQLLLTAAWLFARHGQGVRARNVLEALAEENPRDGVVAAMLADLLLQEHQAVAALEVVRSGEFPAELKRAEALLETRALRMLGKTEEADARWSRFVKASRGGEREWIAT
ncbi:MAG: hypothetical protein J5985_06605 [Kiritimatiellae bacterium]|nr:hypothetical protein [Kiritimatiellia bacterium]